MKKTILLLVLLLLLPLVMAEEQEEEESCGITNLASCLPEKFFQFVLKIINAPVEPLLGFIKDLLSEPVNIKMFQGLWAIVLYIISLFYGLLFMWSGFNLMVSGYNSAKREKAKSWLKDVVIMIVLVQASYYIYSLMLEIAGLLTAGVINMIDENFFLLTIDNLANVGFEIVFGIPYILVLVLTSIILIIRYISVAVGVVFFPVAIFCYFVEPLNSYGKLIMNYLMSNVFVTFFAGIMLLAFSMILEIGIFSYFKIQVMISAFLCINVLIVFLCWFSIIKSAIGTGTKVVGTVAKVVSKLG